MKLLHTLFLVLFGITTAFSQNSAFTFEYKGKMQNLNERMKMRKVNCMNMQIYRNGKLDTMILKGASYGYRTQFEGDFEKGNLIVIFLNSHENWQFLNIDCLNAGARYLKMKVLK